MYIITDLYSASSGRNDTEIIYADIIADHYPGISVNA